MSEVTRLSQSLRDWPSPNFSRTLKQELEALGSGVLPLQQGVSQGGFADDSNYTITVLRYSAESHSLRAEVGVFFSEIPVGCSCGDDPVPETAYCELSVRINRENGEATFELSG